MWYLLISLLVFTVGCHQDIGDGRSTEDTVGPVIQDDTTLAPTTPNTPTDSLTPVTWTEQFMELINDYRTSIGLRTLVHDEGLGDMATLHSEKMANELVAFGHTGFSTRCTDGRSVIGGGNWCGENVAMGQKTPQSAFTSWMNSSGHRANIQQPRATHTGFGYARSSGGTYYWTQVFIEAN